MTFAFVPFLILLVSFLTLWVARWNAYWPYLFFMSLVAALSVDVIDVSAFFAIIIFAGICFGLKAYQCKRGVVYAVLWLLTVIASLAFALHIVPGFSPWVFYENVQLSERSSEYIIRYGYDKAIVGFLLLAVLCDRIARSSEWKAIFVKLPLILLPAATAVLMLGVAFGYLAWDPKLSSLMLWWALGNLFITCAAEEAFFRLLIQKPLQTCLLHVRYGLAMVLVISAVLFGLVHIGGGWVMVAGATVAGFAYALIFYKTGRVEAAIITHFALNVCHFVFFTYPKDVAFVG